MLFWNKNNKTKESVVNLDNPTNDPIEVPKSVEEQLIYAVKKFRSDADKIADQQRREFEGDRSWKCTVLYSKRNLALPILEQAR